MLSYLIPCSHVAVVFVFFFVCFFFLFFLFVFFLFCFFFSALFSIVITSRGEERTGLYASCAVYPYVFSSSWCQGLAVACDCCTL